MKLGDIVSALPALQKLAAADFSLNVLYRVNRLINTLEKQLEFYNEQRNAALTRYGTEVEPGQWTVVPENREAYDARMTELLDVEIEGIGAPVRVPVSENLRLSYNDLNALSGLVELEGAE